MRYYNLDKALENPEKVTGLTVYFDKDIEQDLKQIEKLKKLQTLELSGFALKYFPQELNLPQLKSLMIRNKVRQVPDFVFKMTQLKRLSIVHSPLKTIQSDIRNLINLDSLLLYSNKLESLPQEVVELSNLQIINLESNALKSLPENINNLKNLKTLVLTNNNLQALPENIALMSLSKLYLGYNPFFNRLGQKQKKIAELLRQFQGKDLSDVEKKLYFNLFLAYFEHIDRNNTLEEVLLASSAFSAFICQNALAYLCQKLENPFKSNEQNLTIYIAGKKTQIDKERIESILEQRNIKVSKKLDEKVDIVVFKSAIQGEFDKVKKLNKKWTVLGHLLDFIRAVEPPYLSKTDEETTKMAKNLASLLNNSDSNNQKLALDMALGGGINPVYFYDVLLLYLWNHRANIRKKASQILEYHLSSDLFNHLRINCKNYYNSPSEESISEYLSIICKHQNIDKGILGIKFYQKYNRGKHFCLQNSTSFKVICQDAIKNSVLNLNNSQVVNLHREIKEFAHLKTIYLNFNKLENLPKELKELKKLTNLSLISNKFEVLPSVIFELYNLKQLNLSYNKITTLPDELIKLEYLSNLVLKSNKISQVSESITQLKHLKTLDLSYNNLGKRNVNIEPIWQIRNLKELFLQSTKIVEIPESIFELQNLTYLNLNNNKIKKLPENFRYLKKISKIELKNNPVVKDNNNSLNYIKNFLPKNCEIVL